MNPISVDSHLGTARTSATRTERSRRTRAALVAAVRSELAESGNLTADAVAARAGCSQATFYGHFATNDDAIAAGFASSLNDLYNLTAEALSADVLVPDIDAALERFVAALATFFRTERSMFRAALARLDTNEAIRHLYRESERVTLAYTRDEFAKLGMPDPGAVAESFLVVAQGVNNPRALQPRAAHIRRDIAQLMATLLTRDNGPRPTNQGETT